LKEGVKFFLTSLITGEADEANHCGHRIPKSEARNPTRSEALRQTMFNDEN